MPIPLIAVPLVKAAVELVLLGSLAEIAAFALPVVVGAAVIGGATYHMLTRKEAEQIRQKAIDKYILSNPDSGISQVWVRGNKYASSPVTGYPESKGRYSEFYASRRDTYSTRQYTGQYGEKRIDFEKVIRNGDENDFFRYAEPGQEFFDNVSTDFYPGSVTISFTDAQSWDSLSPQTKRRVLDSLPNADWESIVQSIPATGLIEPEEILKNPIVTGDPDAENPELRKARRLGADITIDKKNRLPAALPLALPVPVPAPLPIPLPVPLPVRVPAPLPPVLPKPTLPTAPERNPEPRIIPSIQPQNFPPVPIPKDPIADPEPQTEPEPELEPKPPTTDICEALCIVEIIQKVTTIEKLVEENCGGEKTECEKFLWLDLRVPTVTCKKINGVWQPEREYIAIKVFATEDGSQIFQTLLQFEEMAKQSEQSCYMRQKLEDIELKISQVAANSVNTMRSVVAGVANIDEYIAESLGKVANALKRYGVVGSAAYPWFPEQIDSNIEVIERVESQQMSADALALVNGEVQNVSELASELESQHENFVNSLLTIPPKDREDNNPVKNKADASTINSIAPELNNEDKEADE